MRMPPSLSPEKRMVKKQTPESGPRADTLRNSTGRLRPRRTFRLLKNRDGKFLDAPDSFE
jgi:hypothetical protein